MVRLRAVGIAMERDPVIGSGVAASWSDLSGSVRSQFFAIIESPVASRALFIFAVPAASRRLLRRSKLPRRC